MVVALSLLGVMKVLPYSTFLIEDVAVVATEPDPVRGFAIGSVRWDVEQLSRDESLTPFRRYFFEKCGEQAGTQAAMCLSEAFAKAFPAGEPQHEFLERHFDPAKSFESHVFGEPGHCVNRSAMLAATLLSVGVPARVVSFSPISGWGGHTLVEVWSGGGWTVVDPTEVGLVGSIRPASAAEIKSARGPLHLFNADGSVRQYYPFALSRAVVRGEVVYPEPWLYTRTGRRFSFWPFRGRFTQVGMYGWLFSTPLFSCRVAFVITVFAGMYFLVGFIFHRGEMEAIEPKSSPELALELEAS